jgi:hypothetical protein
MNVRDVPNSAAHDAVRTDRPEPLTLGAGGFFQRDYSIHPPTHAPGYKSSVLRSPRQALLSLESGHAGLCVPSRDVARRSGRDRFGCRGPGIVSRPIEGRRRAFAR